MLTLQSPVTEINGIGKTRAEALAKAGIRTAYDLLWFFPRAYQDRGDVREIGEDSCDGFAHSFILTVATQPKSARLKNRMSITKFRAADEVSSAELVFFNQPYLSTFFKVGEEYRFYGKLQRSKTHYVLSSPAYERLDPNAPPPDLVPVYRMTEGLTRKALENAVHEVIEALVPLISDPLPESIRKRRGLCTLAYALRNIHEPEDHPALRRAACRLVFDEVFFRLLAVSVCSGQKPRDGGIRFENTELADFLACQPFALTGAQERTVEQICRDMGKYGTVPPMNRIVVGDVGSGKTVCAQAAMYIAAKNGYRSLLMAPTEILARQHFADTEPLMRKLGFRVALLCGSVKAREKAEVLRGLVSEDPNEKIDMVIGTHALISEGVKCNRLGLIVADEQHRFGVSQRAALSERGEGIPHTLVMSATPIPRTLSLAMYGDLDVSRIDEMPPGRQRVDTFAVDESYRDRLNAFIRKNVEEGGQVYIVCPSIEENEAIDAEEEGRELEGILFPEESRPPLKAAVKYAEELKNGAFSDIPLAFLHGKMKPAEKDAVMLAFVRGEIKILVSTTVIEVGVNVPNASLMIVENAERFGLSQLHQLRGRVGRGSRKSYCVLVSDSDGENAKKRLGIMKRTCDGYEIAEMDLAMRGPGDFFAGAGQKLRQHGDTGLRLASSWQDVEIFEAADEEARLIKETDPRLESTENSRLKEAVLQNIDTGIAKLN